MTDQFTADEFRQQICRLLRGDMANSTSVRIAKHHHVYMRGERDDKVYLVLSGLIKVLILTPEGKECLIDLYPPGEIFGELSLCGQVRRLETAVAMQDSTAKQIVAGTFLRMLRRESLLEGLVRYLGDRVAEQQQDIASLVAANSEQRLAMTLLHLARKLGIKDPQSKRITQRLSHTELAKMVGTTRTRVGVFLKRFRSLGLVELTRDRHLIVRESRILEHLERLSLDEGAHGRRVREADPAEAQAVRVALRTSGDCPT